MSDCNKCTTLMGILIMSTCVGAGGIWELSCTFHSFFCESQTSLKNEVNFFEKVYIDP